MDVIFKEGKLYLQTVKFGKRTWRKIWMMLFKPSPSGVGRLELYTVHDCVINHQKKRTGKRVVRLSDCLSITPAPEESCPQGYSALYLNTTLCTYTLASKTCQDWLHALCHLAFQKDPAILDQTTLDRGDGLSMEDNDLYSSGKTELSRPPDQYRVIVQTTEASRRCKLVGEYLVSPDREALLLIDIHTRHIIYHWPYTFLRRYGRAKGGFSIEAGNRCDSGQGMFTFLSNCGPQIYQAIAQQCLLVNQTKDASVQSPNVYIGSLSVHSPDRPNVQLPTTASWPPDSPVSNPPDAPTDTEVEPPSVLYASINRSAALEDRPQSLCRLQRPFTTFSLEAEGEEREDEDGGAEDNVGEDSIYYNLRRWMPTKMKDQTEPETDLSQTIYSVVNTHDTPSPLQPLFLPLCPPSPQLQSLPYPLSKPRTPPFQPQSLPYPLPKPQTPPPQPQSLPYPQPKPRTPPPQRQPLPYPLPKPRYQPRPQPLVVNQIQPWYQPQDQAEEAEEMGVEEAQSCSPSVTPTEIPVNLKQKLSEIISANHFKHLAMLRPRRPSGGDSPPVTHYSL